MGNIFKKIFIFIFIGLALSNPYKPLDIEFLKKNKQAKEPQKKQPKEIKKDGKNSFKSLVKDYEKIEGLFTFYIKENINQVYMELKPEQFNKLYMSNLTRETGDGAMFHGVSMQGELPFYFKKTGNIIQLIEKNIKFRSDENTSTSKALKNQIPDSIIRTVKPIGDPHEETNAILIDANKLFIFDIPGISGPKFQFDKTNSLLT